MFDPLGAAERLDDKVVAYQRGRFACRGSKQTKIEEPVKVLIGGVNFEQKTAITRAIWLHDEIPFGVSQCECTEQILRSGKHIKERNVVFTVIDFGDNARSELPDAN